MLANLAHSNSPFLARRNSRGQVALRYRIRRFSPTAPKVFTTLVILKCNEKFTISRWWWPRWIRTSKIPIQDTRNPSISASFGAFASVLRLLRSALEKRTVIPPSGFGGVWHRSMGSNVHGDVREFQKRWRRWWWWCHLQVLPQPVWHWQSNLTAAVVYAAAWVQVQEAKVSQSHPHGAFYSLDQFQRW